MLTLNRNIKSFSVILLTLYIVTIIKIFSLDNFTKNLDKIKKKYKENKDKITKTYKDVNDLANEAKGDIGKLKDKTKKKSNNFKNSNFDNLGEENSRADIDEYENNNNEKIFKRKKNKIRHRKNREIYDDENEDRNIYENNINDYDEDYDDDNRRRYQNISYNSENVASIPKKNDDTKYLSTNKFIVLITSQFILLIISLLLCLFYYKRQSNSNLIRFAVFSLQIITFLINAFIILFSDNISIYPKLMLLKDFLIIFTAVCFGYIIGKSSYPILFDNNDLP